MKNTNRLFAISVFVVLLLCIPIVSHAVNTGFSTEYEKDLDAYDFAKEVKFSVMKNEPRKEPMDGFDVSESGMIAIGAAQASGNKRGCAYKVKERESKRKSRAYFLPVIFYYK